MGDPKTPGGLKVPASVLSTESTLLELKLKKKQLRKEVLFKVKSINYF